ncbi:MAG: hypothetical protein AB1744_12255, partial [Candidatus Zixiibacteriota bacterium]
PVPLELALGGSARLIDRKLLLASDLRFATVKVEPETGEDAPPEQGKRRWLGPYFHAGAEYLLAKQLSLRAGYSDRRFTAGTGYVFELGKQLLAIDYAFTTGRVGEGSEHIFSFDLLF